VGTVISERQTGEIIADFKVHGEKVLVANGGKGGLGNVHFKSSINRAPRQCTQGDPGEEFEIYLELKVLADVGLLGMPNAGKSSLIRIISAAKPKVANYPFTTLQPNLGVVKIDMQRSFVVADIPGLIEGAADGHGLGHQFLRHLSRTKLLLHILDIAPYDDSIDPVLDAKAIIKELEKYSEDIANKERWLVLNKIDLINDIDNVKNTIIKKLNWAGKVFCISAINGKGCKELTYEIMKHVEFEKKNNYEKI